MSRTQDDVAAEVRAHLARQGYSASRIALRLGWGQKYLSRRLTGAVPFDVNDLAEIAAILDVPVTAFFAVPARQLAEARRPGIYPLRLAIAA